jgi:hypothetical protein
MIECPHGHDGPFGVVEDAEIYYDVQVIDGLLIVVDSDTYDVGDGENTRLRCRSIVDENLARCGSIFEVPTGYEIDWS